MATTTPNFGWPVPTSTDLVKDGATAIEALGDGIDTSMVDLKGGLTGQILSKATNADMDFTWASPNPGDITAVTAGTGITGGGTSGDVTVSFDQANFGGGQFAAAKNKIINGDFNINQRSFTSVTSNGTYGFDRFALSVGGGGGTCTWTPQTFTLGTAPVAGYESNNFSRLVSASQSAAGDFAGVYQRIESVRTFAGQTVTVSFWAKASSGTPNINVTLEQNFGPGGGSSSVPNSGTVKTITTSWARYSFTIALPSISGKTIVAGDNLGAFIFVSCGSTLQGLGYGTGVGLQNVTIDIWGVQVEAGSTATPFQTATGTIQGELDSCKRYFRIATYGIMGACVSTTTVQLAIYHPSMRTSPTLAAPSAIQISDMIASSFTQSSASVSTIAATTEGTWLSLPNFTGLISGRPATLNSSTGITLSAEL